MVIPEGFGQVNIRFTGNAQPNGAEVVFGFENQASATNPDDVGSSFKSAALTADLASIIENDSECTEVLVKFGPTSTGVSGVYPIGIAGDAGSDGTIPSAAVLLKKQTDHGGRTGRGRIYHPFVMAAWTDDGGNIGTPVRDTVSNVYNEINVNMTIDGFPWVLLHGPEHGTLPPYPITTMLAQTPAATQRRRLRP